ncbi:MAG: permease prefix domain 1-containing protein, partial [Oscillospiraceae bacterium]|nr:permease prefix domain 1-containing protein [Oscillospiraceae bacterium]
MVLPETFTHFARTAAEQLRWKAARPLVEDELLTHLCDQRDALMAGGMDEAAAAAESLRLTGDPYEIGTALDRVHRPKTPKLLFALAALIALAGLAFTALVSFRDYELSYFAVHQSVALLLGTAALLAAYFLDFTLLGRFALPLALVFHAALIPLSLLPVGGFWLFRYTYVSTHILLRGLPPLLPLMFAVLLYALRGRRGWGVFAAFVCLAVQCMFCLRVPCLLDLGFLFLCDSALLIFCARNGWFGLGEKLETLLTTLPLAADIVWVLVLGASW